MQGLDAGRVLVPSPLVGPSTWSPVAEEFARRGARVVVPVLEDHEQAREPYWRQHADSRFLID